MRITADYHVHSNFSGDCEATIDSMVEKGIELGLTHMCFTEHLDIDYVYEKPEEEGMFDLDTHRYMDVLAQTADLYKDKITLCNNTIVCFYMFIVYNILILYSFTRDVKSNI